MLDNFRQIHHERLSERNNIKVKIIDISDDKGFVKHFRINISDIKIERRFDYSMSSLSNSKYMIELIVYIVVVV